MAPIRVGIIGLSTKSLSSWAARSHLAYFRSAQAQKSYEIVALLNSSEDAGKAARENFKLPSSVKTYGDPDDLASDPDVDLVACVTFAGLHFQTTAPSLKAGKRELRSLAVSPTVWDRSIIGLQGRVSPPIERPKKLIEDGEVGKVLSSAVTVFSKNIPLPLAVLPESLAFMADKSKGCNNWETTQFRTQIQRPQITLVGPSGSPTGRVTSDVPDLMVIHGAINDGPYVAKGAILSVDWRYGAPPKGSPALAWTTYSEKGEVQLISPTTAFLGTYTYDKEPVTIKVHNHATEDVDNVVWEWEDWQTDLPTVARSTAKLYERYAAWVRDGEGDIVKGQEWPTLSDALTRSKEIDELLSGPVEK
ncbi:hypothetical protein ACJ41O_007393 [Fusarium nematophilum]